MSVLTIFYVPNIFQVVFIEDFRNISYGISMKHLNISDISDVSEMYPEHSYMSQLGKIK